MFILLSKQYLFNHDYLKESREVIIKEYEGKNKSKAHTPFSYTLEKLLSQIGVTKVLEAINCFLTFIEAIFYIISTYTYPQISGGREKINYAMNIMETVFIVYFIAHFALRFYISQARFFFLIDLINFVDYSTIVFLILARQSFINESTKYFFRMFRMIRFLYLEKFQSIIQNRINLQTSVIFGSLVSLIGILLIFASLFLETENNYFRSQSDSSESDPNIPDNKSIWELFSFHDAIYFEFVTLSTVGFGDITPKSEWGRVVVMLMIVFVIVQVPALISQLSSAMALLSKYQRDSYKKLSKNSKHLVLIGDCGPENYDACLQELYHEDHGNVNYNTVIMQTEVNEEMNKIFKDTVYRNKVKYLVGDCENFKDLERCKVDQSLCVLILANKLAPDFKLEDKKNIMKMAKVNAYSLIKKGNQRERICLQLLLPEMKKIFYTSLTEGNDYNPEDQIICIEEIKLQMLGKSCICPGINTIIASLTTSNKPSIEELREKDIEQLDWYEEYLEGLGTEIYSIKLQAELLHSLTFIELVKIIYELTGFIVIGIDVIFEDLKPFVCLNPCSYLLSPFNHVIYLLASCQPNEKEINEQLREHLELKERGIIESNIQMIKLRRLKNIVWRNLDEDGNVCIHEKQKTHEEIEFPNEKEENRHEIRRKNQNPCIENTQGFVKTLHPRTQHDSEKFSLELLDNHIIICGVGPNLKNLIMPLRARSVKIKHLPILILDKSEHISSEIWKEIQYFPDIYFLQGDPMRRDDLRKAGVSKAKAVIILSEKGFQENQFEVIDKTTIFIYQAIKAESQKTLIIVDLISANAIGYLNSSEGKALESHGFWLSNSFANGSLYISSMLDTLVCQSFYNPYILNIIQQLILGDGAFKFPEEITKTLKEKKIIQASLYLFRIKEQLDKFKYQIPNEGLQYQNLFNLLVKHNMIPIGILKNPETLTKQNQRFVFLAPDKHKIIDPEHDKVYVISSEDEQMEEKSNTNQRDYYLLNNMKLIEEAISNSRTLAEELKATVNETTREFKKKLNIAELVSHSRACMRNELADVFLKKEMEVVAKAKEEFEKEIEKRIHEENSSSEAS